MRDVRTKYDCVDGAAVKIDNLLLLRLGTEETAPRSPDAMKTAPRSLHRGDDAVSLGSGR